MAASAAGCDEMLGSARQKHLRVEQAVDEFAAAEVVREQPAFERVACFFEHPSRSAVARKDLGVKPDQMQLAKSPFSYCIQSLRGDPAAPKRLPKPITDFGGMLTRGNTAGIHF